MNPVLVRELRAEARRPVSYWLRMGVAGVFFGLLEMALRGAGNTDAIGRTLFPLIHQLLLGVSSLVAPLLIIEGIAREKREGTIELLLLTPLSLNAVLRAKTVVFTARTLVLMIGALPVVAITVLFGGVGGEELLLLILLQCAAVILALAIGLLAAAAGRTWVRSLALAGTLWIGINGGLAFLLFVSFQSLVGDTFAADLWPRPDGLSGWISGMIRLVGNQNGVWSETIGTIPGTLTAGVVWLFVALLLVSGLVAVLLRAAARATLRRSLDSATSRFTGRPRSSEWPKLRVSGWRRRRWLRRNPVGWLMRYSTEVRLFRWIAAGFVATFQLAAGLWAVRFDGWYAIQMTMALGLGLMLVLAAAAGFRREREDGSLEMLMVTPLTASQLLRGRVTGMWWQFGPAFLAWAVGAIGFHPHVKTDAWMPLLVLGSWVVALFLTVPAIGLEAAFQFRTYWQAASATLAASHGISGMLLWVGFNEGAPVFCCLLSVGFLAAVASLCGPGFRFRLERRRNGASLPPRSRSPRRSRPHRRRRIRQDGHSSRVSA